MRIYLITCVLSLLSSIQVCAQVVKSDWGDPNTIIWTIWTNPPIFIQSGKLKGMGVTDKIHQHLFKQLPMYKHKILDTNIPRVISLAKESSNTCNASWLDTPEWREMFYFSKPYLIVPTNGIIVKKSKRHLFDRYEPISLERVMGTSKLKLGIARLYGEGIDDVLFKYNYKNNPNVSITSKSKLGHLMLMNDRVDYILGYPMEVTFYRKIYPEYMPVAISLKENSNSVPVVMGCAKTPWGKKVIEEVDKILARPGVHELYQGYMNEWLDKNTIQSMDDDYKTFVKEYVRPATSK